MKLYCIKLVMGGNETIIKHLVEFDADIFSKMGKPSPPSKCFI